MTQIKSKSPEYVAARKILGDHRKVFESVADALAALKAIYTTVQGFPQDFPVVGAGIGLIDVTGDDSIPPLAEWPVEYRTEGTSICVTFVGVRGLKDDDGKEVNGARGFAVYPLHALAAIQADETGLAWLWKVAEKEASHVALRGLRNVAPALGTDAFADAAKAMPLTVSDYVEESTRESMDTTAFDTLWKDFRKMLQESAATAPLVPALPGKAEVLKSIRSKAYALETYPDLEKMGSFLFIGQTMAALIERMREQAIAAGNDFELDAEEIKGWIAGRDSKVFAAPKKIEADLGKVDLGAFAAMFAAPTQTEEGGETTGTSGE